MITANKATNLVVGKRISRTASLAATFVTPSALADGEVVVTDAAGKILDTTTVLTAKEVVVVQGQGSTKPLIKSDVIKRGKAVSYKGKKASAAIEQVSFIGYNGTSGSIDAIASNLYFGRVKMLNEQNTFGNRDMYENFKYETGTSTSQKAVAQGLWQDMITIKNAEQMYRFDRIADGTKTAISAATSGSSKSILVVGAGTPAITATVVKGSKTVTFTLASSTVSSVNFAVGDIIEISGVSYIIASLGSTGAITYTITLDGKFQGDSATLAASASSLVKFWNSADPVNWGIKATGVAKTYIPGVFRYYKVRFGLLLKDFGTTTLTEPGTSPGVGASEGNGTTEQIQELEWFYQGTSGKLSRVMPGFPVTMIANASNYLSTDVGFAQIVINFYDQEPGESISETQKSQKSLIIAAPESAFSSSSVGTNFDGAATSVADVLDEFFDPTGGVEVFPALTNTWYNA